MLNFAELKQSWEPRVSTGVGNGRVEMGVCVYVCVCVCVHARVYLVYTG